MSLNLTELGGGWRKLLAPGSAVGRTFHADLKTVGESPAFTFIFFGGSGITAEEYSRRASTSPLVFDNALKDLGREHSFVFAFITAPFDVALEHGNPLLEAHVKSDLLPALTSAIGATAALQWVVGGFSGGAVAALIAARDTRCVSCRLLGADALESDLPAIPHLRHPLSACYNLDDRIYESNSEAIVTLRTIGTLVVHRQLRGGHDLRHYVDNGSFAGIVRTALL